MFSTQVQALGGAGELCAQIGDGMYDFRDHIVEGGPETGAGGHYVGGLLAEFESGLGAYLGQHIQGPVALCSDGSQGLLLAGLELGAMGGLAELALGSEGFGGELGAKGPAVAVEFVFPGGHAGGEILFNFSDSGYG